MRPADIHETSLAMAHLVGLVISVRYSFGVGGNPWCCRVFETSVGVPRLETEPLFHLVGEFRPEFAVESVHLVFLLAELWCEERTQRWIVRNSHGRGGAKSQMVERSHGRPPPVTASTTGRCEAPCVVRRAWRYRPSASRAGIGIRGHGRRVRRQGPAPPRAHEPLSARCRGSTGDGLDLKGW